jgi:hypothetical protein
MSVTLDKRSEAAGSKARRAFAEKSIGFRTGAQPVFIRAGAWFNFPGSKVTGRSGERGA